MTNDERALMVDLATVADGCEKHPYYRGLCEPRTNCESCALVRRARLRIEQARVNRKNP